MNPINDEHIAAMRRALVRIGGDPAVAVSVVQYLEDEGFALVPKTIIGIAGWSPAEEAAYRAGIMYARYSDEPEDVTGVGEALVHATS